MRLLVLLGLLALLPRLASAQDPNAWAVSYDNGATFYASNGGVYDYPSWTETQCGVAAGQIVVYTAAWVEVAPVVAATIFAACTGAVAWWITSNFVQGWNNYMLYVSQTYYGNALYWQFWIAASGW